MFAFAADLVRFLSCSTVSLLVQAEFFGKGFTAPFFGCFEEPIGAIICYIIPQVPSAIARCEIDNRACTFCDCLCGANVYQTRQSIRARFLGQPQEAALNDCFAVWCCQCCAVNQNIRQLKISLNKSSNKWWTGAGEQW